MAGRVTLPPKPARLERRAANRAAWAARATDPEAERRRQLERDALREALAHRLPELTAAVERRRALRKVAHHHERLRFLHSDEIEAVWRGAGGAAVVLVADADDGLGRRLCDPGARGIVVGTVPPDRVPEVLARCGVDERAAGAAGGPVRAGELRTVVVAAGAASVCSEPGAG